MKTIMPETRLCLHPEAAIVNRTRSGSVFAVTPSCGDVCVCVCEAPTFAPMFPVPMKLF